MFDQRLRELERADPLGAERLTMLRRAGRLTEEKLLLMAFCGHPGANHLTADSKVWANTRFIVRFINRRRLQNHMEQWAKALMSLAPSRTTPDTCMGPGGALGVVREYSDFHPKTCICKGTGEVGREIGGIWIGALALVAAAKVALPIWARRQRRSCEGTGKRPILNHQDNTPTGKFDEWPCFCCDKERSSIEAAEIWLADPRKETQPKNNPCSGDWGDMTEAWGGIAPLIWERLGQETYLLGRPMREFVLGTNEATIRCAVETAIIEWALESEE